MDKKKTPNEVVFPPSKDSWFSPERVEYMRNLLSAIVLFLAFPYIISRIIRSPTSVMRGSVSATG